MGAGGGLRCSAAPAALGLVAQLGAETRDGLVALEFAITQAAALPSAVKDALWEYPVDGTPLSVLDQGLARNAPTGERNHLTTGSV